MKKAYFKEVGGVFEFVGFFPESDAIYFSTLMDVGFLYSDDDLYKLIDSAKGALNNIPLKTE